MSRKTTSVDALRARVNHMIASSTDEGVNGRIALSVLLEGVLMDTDNYHGFKHLASEYLPAEEQTSEKVLRDGYDTTRREYL